MAMQELSTALRIGLNPIIFLLNNKGYAGLSILMVPAETVVAIHMMLHS